MITSLIKYLGIFLFCFPIITFAQAQINGDSLKRIWKNSTLSDSIRFESINTYYKSHTYAEPDSILILSEYHYALAEEKNIKIEMSNSLNEKAYAYYIKGDTKSSMIYLGKSIALLEQLDRPQILATVYSNIGNIYGEEGKYQEALSYFYKTLYIFENQGVKKGEARILNNIGIVYYLIDSHELAIEHLVKSYTIYNELGNSKEANRVMTDIARADYQKGNYLEAIEKGKSTIQNLQETNNKFALSDCYFTIAKAYNKLGDDKQARAYIDKCLVIDRTINNQSKIIERLTFDAELFLIANPSKATSKAEKILDLLEDDTRNELKVNLYELLYKCYKFQNRYDLSLKMHEKPSLYKDSLQLQKNETAIVREAVQKDYEDKLLENQIENEKNKEKLEVKHQKKFWLVGLFSALLIFIIGFYSNSKIKANQKEKLLLLEEIEKHKKANTDSKLIADASKYALDRLKIEEFISRKLNETDWKVLNILLDDPVIPNKEIAKKAFMSVDGIGSSLRRMYDYFEVKETKYKKISLLMLSIKISNK